jgi:S1-C subfamily serine protease
MTKMPSLKAGAALALCTALIQSLHGATVDPAVEASRRILTEHRDSVLWISAVCKVNLSASGDGAPTDIPEREQKVETLGTVLGTNGMLVTTLSTIDPSREINGREVETESGGTVKLEASVVVKDVQILMPDGTEIPAELVLKDVDLDLAFIRAKASTKQLAGAVFKPVDLKDNAKAQIAEETVSVSRMGEVFNREPDVTCGMVTSIISKPREFLFIASADVGAPTFNLDGKLIGIGVVRDMGDKGAIPVVMPAADILELAEQAKNAKPIGQQTPENTAVKVKEKSAEKQTGQK